jgi:hypothetical protein
VPNISSQALDVAIGLVFVFFLLSIICSAVHELVATVLSWRSVFLESALRRLLGEDKTARLNVETFAAHPLIRQKAPEKKTLRRATDLGLPSYLAPGTFAVALLDTLAPPRDPKEPREDLLAAARTGIAELPKGDLQRSLMALLDSAGNDIARFRQSLESWYDNTMARVSGWYKRRSQWVLLVIAVIVTLALNADSLQIGKALWRDDVLRAAVAQKAAAAQQSSGGTSDPVQTVESVKELNIPIGWSFQSGDPRKPVGVDGWIGKLLGLVLTTLALSLGAPFWFDFLGKVSRLRGTGAKPAER